MIIAELGSVHDGSFGNALKLIDLAAECKADFVKFQMHIADKETLKKAPNPSYFKDEDRYNYFKRLQFSDDKWIKIIKYCKKHKIAFMCSIFSSESLKKLINFGVKNIKIPSGEVSNIPLLTEVNKYSNLNIFLSTGMSSWFEIDKALKTLKNNKIILMQCTSSYPCNDIDVGLNVLTDMKKKYGNKYKYGFSDHSVGSEAAICSLVYGAEYVEKHVTFSKKMYGSDAKFAMEPNEFYEFCKSINRTKILIKSKINKNNIKPFIKMKETFEKKIVAKRKINKGEKIFIEDLDFKKAIGGVKASNFKLFLGKKIKKTTSKDQVISFKHI